MEQSTLDRMARRFASEHSRRSHLGAMAISALGALRNRPGSRATAAESTPAPEGEIPPPLPFEPGTRLEGDASDEIKRGAITGNFDHFCRIVPYREIDGLAIMEDDIIIGTAEEVEGSDCVVGAGQVAPIAGDQYRWPYGLVPFVFHDSVTEERRQHVRTVIDSWNALDLGLTWIWWHEANDVLKQMLNPPPGARGAPDVVWFSMPADPNICRATIGRKGGGQLLELGSNCSPGAIIHEMAHVAGLFHEQQRPDRDRYVEIVWDNIDPKYTSNFELNNLVDRSVASTPYDYGSIMHYPATAFSVNGEATIVTPNGEEIGQQERLSSKDMGGIRRMYPYRPLCSCPSVDMPCSCTW